MSKTGNPNLLINVQLYLNENVHKKGDIDETGILKIDYSILKHNFSWMNCDKADKKVNIGE